MIGRANHCGEGRGRTFMIAPIAVGGDRRLLSRQSKERCAMTKERIGFAGVGLMGHQRIDVGLCGRDAVSFRDRPGK